MKTVKTLEQLRNSCPIHVGEPNILYVQFDKEISAFPVEIKNVGANNITFTFTLRGSNMTGTAAMTNLATGREVFYDMSITEDNQKDVNALNAQLQNYFVAHERAKEKLERLPEPVRSMIREILSSRVRSRKPYSDRKDKPENTRVSKFDRDFV